ncbi:hypothetical protein E3J62_09680 [candidate division TA06 bacterium]|uniref:Uncharacterized protein n=1 Tax=candidate division TA06 bacterium TaxID=2250710 RepID=A0A523UQ77_UNCT6|nr:MAG: hypothetical protein E3J62_09680 [candidate division TA06 bacterium]
MESRMVTARTMEDEAQAASHYLRWMKKAFGRLDFYEKTHADVKEFARRRKLSVGALKLLDKHKEIGIIYVQTDNTFRRMNEEVVTLLAKAIYETVTVSTDNDAENKWTSAFEKFREAMLKCYRETLAQDAALNIAFEATARIIMESSLRKWLADLRPHQQQYRDDVVYSLSKELSGFFHHLRSKLASEVRFDDSLIVETFSRAQIFPGNLEDIQVNDLRATIRENGLPAGLYESVHKFFVSSLSTEFERKLIELAERKPPTARRDIAKLLEGPPFTVSDPGLVKLHRILVKKAEKLISDSIPELSEVESKLKHGEKKLKTELVHGLEGLNETLSRLSSSQESFSKLSTETKRKLETLEEALNRNFWSIGELKRRQAVLLEGIDNARDLRTLNPKELKDLISRGEQPARISFTKFTEELKLIKQKHGDGLGLLSKTERDALNDTIREQVKSYKDNLKIVKRKRESTRLLEKEQELLLGLSTSGPGRLGAKRFDVDELLRRYLRISEGLIEPFCMSKKILSLFKVWPPESSALSIEGTSLTDEAKYIGEELDYRRKFYRIQVERTEPEPKDKPLLEIQENLDLREAIVENFAEVVTVLVYDIRGSTFMGKRLKNAQIESEIRNTFNVAMLKAAKRHGAFFLKDTGDGGILFFSGNSKEIYDLNYTTLHNEKKTSRQFTLIDEAPELNPSARAAEKAIKCAQEMVDAAKTFVQTNFAKYPNWFRETAERSIFYEGMTYANLPPQYQRIFQIGVGIASGKPGRDLSFGMNSFGDPDITGVLIRDANFYSKARDPRRSVVLCDGATLINFLLNVERFEPTDRKEGTTELVSPERSDKFLTDEVMKWTRLKEERKGFRFSQFGIAIERIGYQLLSGEKLVGKLDLAVREENLTINKFAELLDEKGGEIKVIYEILPEKE